MEALFLCQKVDRQKDYVSGVMGTVRAFPKRSEGPKGKRWNCPHGEADV
ncbi:MAG: hypothetical protein ACOYVK_07395 [Bacillota bacterium]